MHKTLCKDSAERKNLSTNSFLDFVNWHLHIICKYSFSCLPTGHEYPVGTLARTTTAQTGAKQWNVPNTQTTPILLLAQPEAWKISERCCCSSCGFFLFRENVCLSLFWQSHPFGWMSPSDELFLDNSQCEKRERERREGKKEGAGKKRRMRWDEEKRRVNESCGSKWEMKIQRGSAEVWGLEQARLTKAIIICSGMSLSPPLLLHTLFSPPVPSNDI